MKHFNFKLSIFLCFLALGLESAIAQGIKITTNYTLGYQTSGDHNWCNFSNLNVGINNSDWGNSVEFNDGDLTGTSRLVNRHHNLSTRAGDNFDWFTLTYTTPSYSKITYRLNILLQTWTSTLNVSRVRIAYFDYGTDPHNYWSSRNADPSGYTNFRTAAGAVDQSLQGEYFHAMSYKSAKSTTRTSTIDVTIDNNNGNSDNTSYRYGGFSCSKIASTSFNHSGEMWMGYEVISASYYKHITFNPNGGKGDMPEQTVENSANLSANAFTRDGFTFAGWNTQPDGTGTNYANSDAITATKDSKGPVTLYAQWTPEPIKVKFDYTYRTSETPGVETYLNMTTEDAGFAKKVRATFYDHNKTKLTSVILTAPDATTPTDNPTEKISTHKTATITLNVVKGETESLDGTSGAAAYTLTLNATNYANYRSIDFEVMNADATAAVAHWVTDEESATSYIFKYEGHTGTNMFNLKWRVNLKKLSMYPSDIFAKPMRNTSATDYAQIPVMAGIKGIECKLAGYIDAGGNDVTIETYNAKSAEEKLAFNKTGGAYYEGEYNVLKKDASNNDYSYKLGLTGFILDGKTYYLAANQGDIPNDMISDVAVLNKVININYDRSKEQIPVLILSPNGAGATVGGRSDYEIYVDNNPTTEGARTVNLNKFEALRANYELSGWKDAYDGTKVYGVDGVYNFNNGTTTLLAQWQRNSAPSATYTIKEVVNDFKYVVTATDAVEVESVKYIITDDDTEPTTDTGWIDMVKQTDGTYTYTFPMFNNNYGKYIWAKAANDDKSAIISMGQIRSIIKLQGIQNPNSHKQETETIDDVTPTVVDYYDYYATLFYSEHAFIANNVTAYTIEEQGGQLKLVKIEPTGDAEYAIIPNGTAVVLRMEHSTDNVIVLEECDNTSTTYSANLLEGVDDDDTNPAANVDYYIFGYNATYAMGFYLQSPSKLDAHKAFIKKVTNKQNPTQYTLDFENQTVTGIDDIIVDGAANGATYDLLGRKVKATNVKSGIYIKDGKKILVK